MHKVNSVSSIRVQALLLVFLISLVYSQTFFHNLIFLDDDIIVYQRFEEISNIDRIEAAFTSNYLGGHYYRPLTLFSFIIDSAFVKDSVFSYHISNFLIHLLTSLVLFLIIKNLGYSSLVSFICSTFFALNPIHINAIGWIAGRGDLLAGFFSITALLFFQKMLNNKNLFWLLLTALSLLFASLSKEASLPVPFLLLAFLFIEKKDFTLSKTNVVTMLMVLIVVGIYYSIRVLVPDVHIDKVSLTTYYQNFLILPETISKFFLPTGIKALPGIEFSTSSSGLIILLILAILPILFRNINKLRYYWGFTWFILLMLPGMVTTTMGQDGFFYWDCRSYLPLFGLILMIAEVLKSVELVRFKKIFYYFIFIYLLALATFTFFKLKIYKDATIYWSSVKQDYPESFLPYVGLFNYYNHFQKFTKAESQLISAITLRPEEPSVRQLLINYYLRNDEKNKAFTAVEDALINNSISSDFFLEKFISLSNELNLPGEINILLQKYSSDKAILVRINTFLNAQLKSDESYNNKQNEEGQTN